VVSDLPRHADDLPSSVPVVTPLLLSGDGGFPDVRIETDFGSQKRLTEGSSRRYPNNDFTVPSAALLIAAALLSGGLSPINHMSQPLETEAQRAEREARMREAEKE